MKQYKLTQYKFDKDGRCSKTTTWVEFRWNSLNHCWEITRSTVFGSRTFLTTNPPEWWLEHDKECCLRHSYVSVKVK